MSFRQKSFLRQNILQNGFIDVKTSYFATVGGISPFQKANMGAKTQKRVFLNGQFTR